VTHINPARPVVKVRVYSEALGVVLSVDVSWERYAELCLTVGETVWVTPAPRFRAGLCDLMNLEEEPAMGANQELERSREALARLSASHGLRYGTVTAVAQDGVVAQVERTEKIRLEKREPPGASRRRERQPTRPAGGERRNRIPHSRIQRQEQLGRDLLPEPLTAPTTGRSPWLLRKGRGGRSAVDDPPLARLRTGP
jgi:hypothetical protein